MPGGQRETPRPTIVQRQQMDLSRPPFADYFLDRTPHPHALSPGCRTNGIRFEKNRSAPLRVFYNPLIDWDLFLFFWSVQKKGLRCDVFFGKLCCMALFRTESGWVRESWI